MITETLARSLTTDELALRLADEHDDPAVRYFAQSIIDGAEVKESEAEEELQGVQSELDDSQAEVERLEGENSELEQKVKALEQEVRLLKKQLDDARDNQA